ncbi:SusC/RagA family TonB-linked outer membrane protein [Polaribacter aestuariivivens]|uniref:SusC/RagA family TonB-linked outer membrane protein n=1 Tax=Polaribacter aestuariivivens TaxID=2304626 RepID=UPI003F494844
MCKSIKKRKQLLVTFLMFFAVSFSVYAQKTVKGTVLDEIGLPLPSASVTVKGTANGTSTDFDGKFSITVANDAKVLVVSYIGYKTKEVAITNNDLKIALEVEANSLNEIIVVGYGTRRKSDVVGAVAKADLSKATATPTSDVTEMLRGRVSGLRVDVGGGSLRPGGTSEILLRGRSSIEGNVSGIYVVDGIIREGGIEDINPDDIESIEVLKDASAQAIYGAKGSNGVILITTKRGKNNKVNVSYHGFLTTKKLERNFDVYSGQEYAQLRREAVRATRADNSYPDDADIFSNIELNSIANNEFVDWENELVAPGIVNSHSLSIVGGTEFTKVYGSVNYFREEGIIPTSTYTRKNLRLNVDQKITDKISARFDINLLNDLSERAANVNVITFSPLGRAYDDMGNITQFPSGEDGTAINPLWNLREEDHDEKGNDFVVNFIPTYQITDDLKYQLTTSLTRKTSERGQYQSSLSGAGDSDRGIARIDNQLREAFFIENIITYNKEFNPDNIFNLTLASTMDENKFTQTFTEGRGFPNESLGYDGITNAIGGVEVQRNKTKTRNLSYMARARYNFMDKYLVTGTVRRDGSSVNARDFKWTTNPAIAFAWKMQNESFIENIEEIQELKLRVTYGSLINSLSRPYTSLFTAAGQNYVFDGESASGYSPSVILPNPQLEHERITTFNIGVDFSLFDRFLTGSLEYYDAITSNLLLRRGVPSTTGYQYTFFNAGEAQNKGIELSLTANLINNDDFRWSVSTIWSNNQNKLLSLYNDGNGNPILEDDAYNYFVGQPTNVLRQYQFDGIWQEGDDFANAPQANPDSAITQTDLRPGDIRIKDTNGVDANGNVTGVPDGKITQEDRVFIDPNPDWFGSLSTTMEYKGFDLFLDFYAVEGATKVNPFLSDFNNGGTLSGKLNGVKVPYYTPENPSTTFPRPNFDAAPQYLNALAVKDASYVRLRTISLGYTLPDVITTKLSLSQIKLYVTGTNLFTKTDYIGYSPEVNIRSTFSNADTGYPDATAFTFGVKIKL